ncbi:transglutaminase-like cysteine peptidase [Romboutsia sedimentorum]|uniref:transglutaminase domain-containing protein n=1 Tax=Romboutsia sedimentorum TaxID=1368474 RepID=UPI0024DEEDDA|nr:transglutaminase-like domain-containing protein [Romboutsia sedimentorum]MDK2587451.1 transglutaminase-like cysteine peptidase [Romboutsia sedimentorum]
MIYDKEYWDNKYEKKSIVYACRCLRGSDDSVEIDVRNFICANDSILQKYIQQYNLKKDTYNETALAIQSFIVDNFTYISDLRQDGVNEYWQFPYESIASFKGDCEDGAIILASFLINSGIPSYRVRVCAGTVQANEFAPVGGHAFCTYLRDNKDNDSQDWCILDWCYYQDTELKCEDKPLLSDGGYNGCYKDIWWSFNNEYSWSNKEVVIDTTRVRSEVL